MARYFLLLLLLPLSLFAFEGYLPADKEKPWFTGPLLTSSGNTAQANTWNIEPYVFLIARTSFYNNHWKPESEETLWTLQYRFPVWIGIGNWMDFKVVPQWSWKHRGSSAQWTFDDLMMQASFQLYRDRLPHPNWLPSMKIFVRENCPTGKYQHLDVKKKGTDRGGDGSWITILGFCASKVFYFYDYYFLNVELDALLSIPTEVHVKGLNAYGGGAGTNGTVKPGNAFELDLGFEYELSRRWALALDVVGAFTGTTRFSGKKGDVSRGGLDFIAKELTQVQYSIAPAIEYNWNENIGLIVGSWFTVAGKNASRFTSGAAALNCTF